MSDKREFPRFRGMMPILPTTVNASGAIDTDDIASMAEYCVNAGSVAIGHLAGASAYSAVGSADREVIISALVKASAGRLPVFIGAAANSMQDTVRNAEVAESLGADMIMLCTPPIGSADQGEIFDYYRQVCGAVKLPVIVQDTGNSAGVFSADFLVKLYESIDNIGYVKAEGGFWQEKMYRLSQIAPKGLQIIGGAAGTNMPLMLRLGVTAFMTGTEAQEIHNGVVQAYLAGDEERAWHLYCTTLLPYLELYTASQNHTALKHMLARRGIIKNTSLLFPLRNKGRDSEFCIKELDWMLDRIDKGLN